MPERPGRVWKVGVSIRNIEATTPITASGWVAAMKVVIRYSTNGQATVQSMGNQRRSRWEIKGGRKEGRIDKRLLHSLGKEIETMTEEKEEEEMRK